jgi:glutathionyl-hydroquinone reductase
VVLGVLVEGEWRTERQQDDEKGRFVRSEVSFRDFVTTDGSSGYTAKSGRYHLVRVTSALSAYPANLLGVEQSRKTAQEIAC